MEKKRQKKRKVGRPSTGRRPVLATRVHGDLYEKLRKSSVDEKLSISEEAARRLQLSFDWELQLGDMQQALADHRRALQHDLEAHLARNGWMEVHSTGGEMWLAPGFDLSQVNLAIDVSAVVKEMEPGLIQVLAQALGKFAKKDDGGHS